MRRLGAESTDPHKAEIRYGDSVTRCLKRIVSTTSTTDYLSFRSVPLYSAVPGPVLTVNHTNCLNSLCSLHSEKAEKEEKAGRCASTLSERQHQEGRR